MIEHILLLSHNHVQGNKIQESKGLLSHALPLMMAKRVLRDVKEHGHFERWLLPVMVVLMMQI
jgi:hypothetical protein